MKVVTEYAFGKLAQQCWQEVPHMNVAIGKLSFFAPVAVIFAKGKNSVVASSCEQDDDGYLYALPGGGRITSNGKIL